MLAFPMQNYRIRGRGKDERLEGPEKSKPAFRPGGQLNFLARQSP
jgi:hypothetical protein